MDYGLHELSDRINSMLSGRISGWWTVGSGLWAVRLAAIRRGAGGSGQWAGIHCWHADNGVDVIASNHHMIFRTLTWRSHNFGQQTSIFPRLDPAYYPLLTFIYVNVLSLAGQIV
jgi:hypothetical protein